MNKRRITRAQIKLLEKLSNAVGVSGNEDEIRQIVINEIKPYVDEYKTDMMGNLLAVKHAKTPGAPRVIFAAHMDEGVRLDNAYRVQLDPSGRLYWITEDAGKEVRYDVDPLSTPLQRFEAGWIRMLPIQDLL